MTSLGIFFDRVFKSYLLSKLYAAGVGTTYLNFLDSYLAPRRGKVVVQGESSEIFDIEDSVYQGTVFEPLLWSELPAHPPSLMESRYLA